MVCKKCSYKYQYEGEVYEWEHCPICGNTASFEDFVKEKSNG